MSMTSKVLKTAKVVPAARLLTVAQVLMLARRHWLLLEPHERRRLVALVRQGRGRPRNLSPAERLELVRLIAKADPRLFAGLLTQRFSPVRLPRRMVPGRAR
jgi:hypothetical protein